MAQHYVGNIRHITCESKSGKRCSPLSDIAYNTGQVLRDYTTNRQHCRPHTDGTEIIATDIISADPNCKYGDRSVSSVQRREQMYNELASLNKKPNQRVYAKTEIAIPNSLTDEQMVEVAEAIALALSERFNRPFDFSVHKKKAKKKHRANNHIHLCWPERQYQNGKWGPLSKSYYIRQDGSLILDKNYKNQQGNDIRVPRTINNEEPDYRTDEYGHIYCHNQRRGNKNDLQWKMKDVAGLTPDDITWIHNEVDRINNSVLEKYHINDRVKRNDPRITKMLKDSGLKPVHYGLKDARQKNEDYYQKLQHNKRSDFYKNVFMKNLTATDNAEKQLTNAIQSEQISEDNLLTAIAERAIATMDQMTTKREYKTAVSDYIDALNPESQFVANGIAEITPYLTQRNKFLNDTSRILKNGIKQITTVSASCSIDDQKARALSVLLKQNQSFAESLYTRINNYLRAVPLLENAKSFLKQRWQQFSPQDKLAYLRKHIGDESATFYADFLSVNENTSCHAPSHFPFTLQLDKNKISATLTEWNDNMTSKLHIPPIDVSLINDIAKIDSKLMGTSPVQIVPNGYDLKPHIEDYYNTINNTAKDENRTSRATRLSNSISEATITNQHTIETATAKRLSEDPTSEATVLLQGPYTQETYDYIKNKAAHYKRISATQIADAMINSGRQFEREKLIQTLISTSRSKMFNNEAKRYNIDISLYKKWAEIRTDYFHKKPSQLQPKHRINEQGNEWIR